MSLLYFEDFQIGERLEFGDRAVSAEEIVAFARVWDPQPFHVNPVAAKDSQIGELIASGWHTAALTQRLICDAFLTECAVNGLIEVEEMRWLKPLRPGDRLSVRRTTVAHRSAAIEAGTVVFAFEVVTSHGEALMASRIAIPLRRRPEIVA